MKFLKAKFVAITTLLFISTATITTQSAELGSTNKQPAEPGRYINCDEAAESIDLLEEFINLSCNGGVGPFPNDIIDLCIQAIEGLDYLQGEYNKHCLQIAIQN